MAKKVACPQCGAKNALDSRRCRICALLLNAEVPEVAEEEPAAASDGGGFSQSDAFVPLPGIGGNRPFSGGGGAIQRRLAAASGQAPNAAPPSGGLGPPPSSLGPVQPAAPPSSFGPAVGDDVLATGADITFDVVPRNAVPDPAPPPPPPADEVFDPNALFRDMGREPPPPPPAPADELRLAPQERGPDPLWSLGENAPGDLSPEEIDRLTAEALREERLRKRPGFLDKVFKPEDDPANG